MKGNLLDSKSGQSGMLVLMVLQALASLLFPPYRDTGWIKDTWFVNDLVTLAVVCPLYLYSIVTKSPRAMMVSVGVFGYVVYNYCFYLLGTALNVLFPLYVVLVVVGIIGLSGRLGAGTFADSLDSGFDRQKSYRLPGLVFLVLGAGLGCVWLGTWASFIFLNGTLPTGEPEFRLVASLDLVIMVASLVVSGIGLLRKRRVGFLLGSSSGIQAFLYLLVLASNAATQGLRTGRPSAETPLWLSLFLVETVGIVSLVLKSRQDPVR